MDGSAQVAPAAPQAPAPDPRPMLPNVPTADYSIIRNHPAQNCQQAALDNEALLKDEGYNTRIAEAIIPPSAVPNLPWDQRLHFVTLFQRDNGSLWARDPRYGDTPMRVQDLPYIWVTQEQ